MLADILNQDLDPTETQGGSMPSTPSSAPAAPSRRITCSSAWWMPRAPRRGTCPSSPPPSTSTPFRRTPRSATGRRRRGVAHPLADPLERPWPRWCAPTANRASWAATSPVLPPAPRCTTSASITSGAPSGVIRATCSTSRATSPASTPAPSSKGASTKTSSIRYRTEVDGGGLSSYPHPWLMPISGDTDRVHGPGPDRWPSTRRFFQVPGAPQSDARHRPQVWCFMATARPTSRKRWARSPSAGRENLDNLIFVINCNLQRLDGPVRGNGRSSRSWKACSAAPAGTSSR